MFIWRGGGQRKIELPGRQVSSFRVLRMRTLLVFLDLDFGLRSDTSVPAISGRKSFNLLNYLVTS